METIVEGNEEGTAGDKVSMKEGVPAELGQWTSRQEWQKMQSLLIVLLMNRGCRVNSKDKD